MRWEVTSCKTVSAKIMKGESEFDKTTSEALNTCEMERDLNHKIKNHDTRVTKIKKHIQEKNFGVRTVLKVIFPQTGGV